MANNGHALQKSGAPLVSSESAYPGLRPTVRLIAKFALRGQSRAPVHKAARNALRSEGVELLPLQKQTPDWRERAAHAIYEWMGPNVAYAYDPEGIEQVQEPTATLMLGQGDCDDMVSLAIAMLTSVGVPARIKVIRQTGSDVFNHIYAEYQGERQGTTRGERQWNAFDATLRRPEKGEYGRIGDAPDPSLIAESVEVPVTGAPEKLGPRTLAALRQLPADAGVVPDQKLQDESNSLPSNAPSSMQALSQASPTRSSSGGLSKTDRSQTSNGDLTRSGAPGTSKGNAVSQQKDEVVVVPPSRYVELVQQAAETGDFECTVGGRMVIRDAEGREILPSSEVQPSTAGIGEWILPLLFGIGGVTLVAALTSDDDEKEEASGSDSNSK